MCSISGIINKSGEAIDESLLRIISDRMILRGPDDGDIYIDNNIGLAHRRLSIIDLSTGNQPMQIEEGQVVIVYNGEVYNFCNLKEELEKKGHRFVSTSDTEVVARCYVEYGIEGCLSRLEGMFAFAIYDRQKKTVYIARDRYGEKPLYFYEDDHAFYFASELKAFSPSLEKFDIDETALNLFLTLSYIPAPYTIYKGVHKLQQGCYMEFDEQGIYQIHQYYNPVDEIGKERGDSYKEAIEKLKSLLTDSVRQRMVSDVPMGAFLSGGIDSSIICCLMASLSDKPINTFSIGFDERDYDESDRAEAVAKHIGSNHKKFILHYNDVLDILDDIIDYYDEPFGDSSAIPSYYVAKLAHEDVKVVLTGDCADELFGGYEKYLAEYYSARYQKLPKLARKGFEKIVNAIPLNDYTNNGLRKAKKVIQYSKDTGFDLYYDMLCLGFNDEERFNLLKPEFYTDIKKSYRAFYGSLPNSTTYLQKEQVIDVYRVLEGQMFPKVDRACMHNSLENRAPFIDSGIVDFALNLPDKYKIDGNNKKKILKDAFRDVLPKETLEFSKRGFGVPVDHWFRNELKEELTSLLNEEVINKQGIFNYEYISKLLEEHISGKENHKGMLWNLFVFQKWYLNNT